jgi:dethiobiotin synthetase
MDDGKRTKILVVSGTDTGVGKTLVAGLLLRELRRAGVACGYQKWVATGGKAPAEDLVRVCELSGLDPVRDAGRLRVDHCFELAASPHLAAETEGGRIDPRRLLASTREMAAGLDRLIVEGAGGLMVPLDRGTLMIDLAAELGAPVLLVARTGVGTINHSLLSVAALRARNIPCAGIVFSDEGPGIDERVAEDNRKTIAELGRVPCLGRLRWSRDDNDLARQFATLTIIHRQTSRPQMWWRQVN